MKLGFIGAGKMAGALVGGVIRSGEFAAGEVLVSNRTPTKATELAERTGARAATNLEVAETSDVIVACVKPAQMRDVLRELAAPLAGKLVISVAAGISLETLRAAAGTVRVIRAMPNTPSLIGRGAAGIALGPGCADADREVVRRIFESVGLVFFVGEELMDAVVGVSGSGPAYLYLVIEALVAAGVELGLPSEIALPLAAQTVAGAGEMVRQTGLSPAELRAQVTSPNGTTMAALAALHEAGLPAAIRAGVQAAAARSVELGRGA